MKRLRSDVTAYLEGERFERTKNRIVRRVARHGFGALAEDCAQEYAVAILSGRSGHQTIDQFVVDYLRKRIGSTRSSRISARKLESHADSYEQGNYDRSIRAADGFAVDDRLDIVRMDGFLGGRDREIFRAYFVEGLSEAEIGDHHNVTESRVSQILKRIQSRLSERIAAPRSAREREERRKLASILFGAWQRMEFETSRSLAFKESREMATIDGARFEKWIA